MSLSKLLLLIFANIFGMAFVLWGIIMPPLAAFGVLIWVIGLVGLIIDVGHRAKLHKDL